MHIILIQPSYPWGTHIYLPNGLISMAARIIAAGHSVTVIDENIESLNKRRDLAGADCFGIGILGAPYAASALKVAETLRRLGHHQPIVFGGEFINRLTTAERTMLLTGIDNCGTSLPIALKSADEVSMTPAIEALPEYMARKYFSREFCFFTSQGCAFNCNFCAAEKGVPEHFRLPEVWENETKCIAKMVRRFAGPTPEFSIYLSTLDCCQTPKEMERVLKTASQSFAQEGIALNVRALATAKCTAKIVEHDPEILRRWRNYGLTCLAIGVDGNDPAVWKRENKRHNTEQSVREALDAILAADMLAEALMVVGFPSDSPRAILQGALACMKFTFKGIRARPYQGKPNPPGSKGWKEDRSATEYFLQHPKALSELDYGSCGSPVTHPNRRQRWMSNGTYLATVAALKAFSPYGCPTQPLMPTATIARPLRPFARAWNRAMPADK